MSGVQMQVTEFPERCREVRGLLLPICRGQASFHVQPEAHPNGGKVVSGSDAFSRGVRFDERKFRTVCDRLFAQYYEIWVPTLRCRYYLLTHCYFHLFYVWRREPPDYVFGLHAEPEHGLTGYVDRCRAGPHIHINVKEERLKPLSQGHFPLFYSTVEKILASKTEFDRAMGMAMRLVEEEVVKRFGES